MEFSSEDLGQIVNDIWTSMLGFPVQARSAPAEMNGTRHLSASVQISGGWDGTVLVSCAEDLARKVAATMFDVDESTTTDDEIRDALGEVANMTAGNVKALVESYCRLSLPMVAEGRELAISIPGSRVVAQASFDCDDAPLTIEVYEKAAPLLRPVGGGYAAAPPPSTPFGFVGSIRIPGPIVVERTSERIYRPFAEDGFALRISSTTAR
jgi:chemotaxis protein CheX